MRKIACTLTLLSLLLVAGPAQAQTVSTRGALESCHTGSAPLERYATFAAQMGAIQGTRRMQVRFDLLEKVGGAAYRRVSAPGLGVWRSSVPGVDIFRYRKQVANLQAPGSYRALVRFRWIGDGGKVLKSTTRRTGTCKQPDLRTDLAIGRVSAERAGAGRARYSIVVRNFGRLAAPSFSVAFAVGDEAPASQTVQSLGGGEKRTLTFTAPRCNARTPVRVALDPDLAIEESNEGNNARTLACPLDG
jgi:CARDB